MTRPARLLLIALSASAYILVTHPLIWLSFVGIGIVVDVAVIAAAEVWEWRRKRVEVPKMWRVR